MIHSLPPYIQYIASIIISAAISIYAVRKIIFITRKKNLFDVPDSIRKIHGANIPSLGGIGIFIGFIVPSAFFMGTMWSYIIASCVILFFTGIYDDIMNMRPYKKLVAQLVASALTIYVTDIRLESLYGLFGIFALPYWLSIGVSILLCTFYINVFNFVDGIDGLACTLAIFYTLTLGILFAGISLTGVAAICFSLAGATAGLLFFNRAPAKIYMGDTGSMLLGFMIFILSLLFVNMYGKTGVNPLTVMLGQGKNGIMLITAMLFLPVFDALRVFALRASKGISPLKADRTHLHYYLLDAGLGHSKSVAIIVGANVVSLLVAFIMQGDAPIITLIILVAIASGVMLVAQKMRRQRTR
ncbi:MAG: MraY family glycosyltransferase [Bacteroidota bacterium]